MFACAYCTLMVIALHKTDFSEAGLEARPVDWVTTAKLRFHAQQVLKALDNGGPGRTWTFDQWIHLFRIFLSGADYLIILNAVCLLGCGTLLPVIKDIRFENQSPGSLCTFRRFTFGLAQDCHQHTIVSAKVSLNSSRSFHIFRYERTILMSPLL